MFEFFEALKKKSTSKKIKAGIAEAEAALAAARDALVEKNNLHGPTLLDGDDAAVDAIEGKIAAKTREVDRLVVGIEAMEKRLAEAEADEANAALDRTLKAAQDSSRKGVALLDEYAKHAEAIREIMIELSAIDRVVREANTAAGTAGDERRIDTPDKIAHENSGGGQTQYQHLPAGVILPRTGGIGRYFWKDNSGVLEGVEIENQIINLAEKKSA